TKCHAAIIDSGKGVSIFNQAFLSGRKYQLLAKLLIRHSQMVSPQPVRTFRHLSKNSTNLPSLNQLQMELAR
ncbi:MAG: hypothetical protein AAFZ63_28915, partial [Bacteroidota bacterium]